MKGIQMGADPLDGGEILDHAGAGFEDAAFGCQRGAGVAVVVDGEILCERCHFLFFFFFLVSSGRWLIRDRM